MNRVVSPAVTAWNKNHPHGFVATPHLASSLRMLSQYDIDYPPGLRGRVDEETYTDFLERVNELLVDAAPSQCCMAGSYGCFFCTVGIATFTYLICASECMQSRAHRRLLELIDEENEHLAKLNHKWTIVDTQAGLRTLGLDYAEYPNEDSARERPDPAAATATSIPASVAPAPSGGGKDGMIPFRFCGQCGTRIPTGNRFCNACGTAAPAEVTVVEASLPGYNEVVDDDMP